MQKTMIANALRRVLSDRVLGFFGSPNTKASNLYADFGYPDAPTFWDFYNTYRRNGVAHAAVSKTIGKTWQDNPWVMEREETHDETRLESEIRQRFDQLQFWNKLRQADTRSLVGRYAAVIFRFGDGKLFSEPVDRVPGGLNGLVEVIPVWEEQLKVAQWDTDERSLTYGWPTMYQFNESSVEEGNAVNRQTRSFMVHPSRVHIWSQDGTVWNESALEPGLNSLIDIEKINGSGAEGFWKNAKSSPVLNMDKEASPEKLAAMLGVEVDGISEALDDVVGDWQKGFDQLLMLQGIEAKTLGVTLPANADTYLNGPLQAFAASFGTPMKILVGSQTGERASTEDKQEWNETNMSRRSGYVMPNIRRILEHLEAVGILPPRDWWVSWSDLTAPGLKDKVELVGKLADAQQKLLGTGEVIVTGDELREYLDKEPLGEMDFADADPEDDQ